MSSEAIVETTVADRDMANVHVGNGVLRQARSQDEPIGDLFFCSVPTNTSCRAAEFVQLMEDHGAPESWAPRAITSTTAFKRAVDELKQERSLEQEDNGALLAVLVRDAQTEKALKHIVLERRTGTEKPKYTNLGHFVYLEKHGMDFQCYSSLLAEEELFERMKAHVQMRFRHYSTHITDRDVRSVIDRAKADMASITLMAHSPLNFVPIPHRNMLQALVELLKAVGCRPWVIPMAEMNTDPEQIGERLVDTVSYEVTKLLAEVAAKKEAGASQKALEGLMRRAAGVKDLVKQYQNLLELDLEEASVKVAMLGKQISELPMKSERKED